MKHSILFILLSLFVANNSLFAQTVSDNQLWTGASVGLKLNKKFTISLREEFRFDDNMSSRKLILLKLELNIN